MDSREQFNVWWEIASRRDEFRGCSMPAALAAWQAGRASVETKIGITTANGRHAEIEVKTPNLTLEQDTSARDSEPARGKRGKEKQKVDSVA